jgi:hypothetical protein
MDLKHVFQRIRDFLNMHFKVYDIVNCKHYIQLLKAYKPMALQRYTLYIHYTYRRKIYLGNTF